ARGVEPDSHDATGRRVTEDLVCSFPLWVGSVGLAVATQEEAHREKCEQDRDDNEHDHGSTDYPRVLKVTAVP
ncbi:MAG: hypothetical protein ACRDVC_04550, partial [Acidimicrobiales bacterium]